MRQILFFALFLIAACSIGCGGPDEGVYGHTYYYNIVNKSDREIAIHQTQHSFQTRTVILYPPYNQDEEIYRTSRGYGPLSDPDISPIPITGDRRFWITIDGEMVSDEIWLGKNWKLKPRRSDASPSPYTSSYILEITDKLLNSLPPAEPELPPMPADE